MMAPDGLKDWVPIRIYRRDAAMYVDWCCMAGQRFTHPFFQDTIHQRMREPFNLVFRHQTPIELLGELYDSATPAPPTGFIFHMSRCGSTLVAQMLAALPKNIVISEAPPIDTVIAAERTRAASLRGDWLRWVIAALGQQRPREEQNYFIKFDSWNTLDLSFIRAVFPEVPWIFLYRDPIEVLVSQMNQRGIHMVPGAVEKLLHDVNPQQAAQMPVEEYCARVLGEICSAAYDNAKDRFALLVNYDELPQAATHAILQHFGVSFTEEETECMKRAARYNSKTPAMFFESDKGQKQGQATDAVRRAVEDWIAPIYARLEDRRTASMK